MALVPERESEETPQLAAPVLGAGDVLVEQACHRLRLEKPLGAQRSGRQGRAGERLELAAQPGGGWNREAALASVHDFARHERCGSLAQQHLFRESPHLVLRRERKSEVGHDGVEERHARFERMGHRRTVGLHEQVVDEVNAEVDVLEACERLGALRLGITRAINVDRIEAATRAAEFRTQIWCEDLLPPVMPLERR